MNDVTVIIPVFNGGQRLLECLSSPGLRRGGPLARVLVVDNGSTDGSGELAVQLGADVIEARRPGPAAARNAGVYQADTEYVAFLDADGVACEGWVERLLAAADGHVGVGGRLIWQSGVPGARELYQQLYPTNADCSRATPNPYLLTANALFRRVELMDAGGFDSSMTWSEDLELGIRLSAAGGTFGYAHDATVTLEAPAGLLDRFTQFYKYGVGLNQTLARHPGVVPWSPWEEWAGIASALAGLRRGPSASATLWAALVQLAYLTGWLDARLRSVVARGLRQAPSLPVIRRLAPRRGGRPAVALSIDDGPSAVGNRVLDLLRQYDARATFFVTGAEAMRRPDLIRAMTREHHEVFPHSWTHRRMDLLGPEEIQDEMHRTEVLLEQFRPAPTPYLVRLPYGAGCDDPYVHRALQRWRPDCQVAQWTVSIADWELAAAPIGPADVGPESSRVASRLAGCGDLSGSIILLHDMPFGSSGPLAGEATVGVLQSALEILTSRGYAIHPIGEML